jgi:multiple sugar transport system permease protein
MMGEFNVNYGALAAGSIIALVPSVILFMFAQKHLVNGMGGAVKG